MQGPLLGQTQALGDLDGKHLTKANKGIYYPAAKGRQRPNYCLLGCKWFHKQSAQGNFIISGTIHNIAMWKSKLDEINLAITGGIKRSSLIRVFI